jgi:ectoine hydroxylase-related dioxygenase (phytanoyl-CoA dioxygenase family)
MSTKPSLVVANGSPVPQEPANTDMEYHKNTGYDIRDDVNFIYDELVRLGLTQNALELDVKGLTVIPPESVAGPEFTKRVRDAVVRTYEKRHGETLDVENAETLAAATVTPFGKHMAYMLLEDPVFSELMMNEALLAVVGYRLGRNFSISNCQALIKAKGGQALALHTDELLVPPPYQSSHGGLNATYTLTDYTVDDGALLYVPGSHKHRRLPVGDEGADQVVPVEAPAGSFILWDGATWHGALARQNRGLRLNTILYFIRPHMRPMEVFFDKIDEATIAKYPPRYRTLIGESLKFWWNEEGPPFDAPDWSRIGTTFYR